MRPHRLSPLDAAMVLGFRAKWEALLAIGDQAHVWEVLETALSHKATAQILVRRLGEDALRAATLRCFPNSLPREPLRLHHLVARALKPETLQYLIEEVGGFPADEPTDGPLRLSLLHLAAMAGGEAPPPALQERRLACLRYLVEEQGLSSLLTDARGLRPIDFVENGESGAAVRQFLLEAARGAEAATAAAVAGTTA